MVRTWFGVAWLAALMTSLPVAAQAPQGKPTAAAENTEQAACKKAEAFGEPAGSTLQECERHAKALVELHEQCGQMPPGYYMKDVSAYETTCKHKYMLAALDKRLLALKAKAPKQFKAEMKLQADFNKAVNQFCEETDCSATGEGTYGCGKLLTQYRALQADQVNSNTLAVDGPTPKTKAVQRFAAFARGLCAMPKEVWSGGRPPAKCEQRVLGAIEQVTGHTPECEATLQNR
jgi:hypothetical protein